MKQTVKKLFTLLILMVFFVYTSGLVVTVHHCCRAHHHCAQDHRHCSENTYVFKITSQFTKSSDRHVEDIIPLMLFLNNDVTLIGAPWGLLPQKGLECVQGSCLIFQAHIYQLLSHLLL